MKDNKLIAEFMGYINNGDDEFLIHPVTNHDVNDFPYDTSWDWLMPVVQRCYTFNYDQGFNPFPYLCDLDITTTHEAVVEFIKTYNKEDEIPTSGCCGAETTETEMGICPKCLEHCEFE